MALRRPLSVRSWLGIFAAAVALPLVVLIIWTFVSQVQAAQENARDTSLRIARATAAQMQAMHEDSLALLQRMSARPAIRDFDGSCDSLFEIIDFFPLYANLLLFDAHGNLLCQDVPKPARDRMISAGAETWIRSEILAGRLPVRTPMTRTIGGEWVSVLATPVVARDGSPRGVLALVQMPEIADRETLPPHAVITILDRNATVVARSEDGYRWTGRDARSFDIAEIAKGRREGSAEAKGPDGVSRQYGFASLPGLGWSVYIGIPTSVVMRPVRALVFRIFAGSGAAILIVLIVAIVQMRAIERPIESAARAADSVARGAPSDFDATRGPREIARLTRSLSEIVDRRSESERKMKTMSDRLLVIQEHERTRIARELHDDLGQSLTALKMDVLGIIEKSSPSPIRDRIVQTLDSVVGAVQRISSELRPSILDDLGLVAAIESEADLFTQRTGIECELSLTTLTAIDGVIATAIYRIVQEALTNVARHSNASRVELRLRERSGELLLEVRDDGRGVTAEEISDPMSLGLIGIRERADLVGGIVQFEGVAGRGTIVSVRIPRDR
jgi:signal transduction histidine kinase